MNWNIFKIFAPAGWMHEIFHWIPAKLLATNVKAYPDHVEYDLQTSQWKNVVIASGPLVAALIILGLVKIGISKKRIDRGWMGVAWGFLGTCFWDVMDLIYFAKHKKWKLNIKD